MNTDLCIQMSICMRAHSQIRVNRGLYVFKCAVGLLRECERIVGSGGASLVGHAFLVRFLLDDEIYEVARVYRQEGKRV